METNYIFIGENYKTMSNNEFKKFNNLVDMIYIDPPYNTGNKFSFSDTNNKWYDDIYKRLSIAKSFLKKSGMIYISIDDSELVSLLTACYKVFGKENFCGIFITKQSLRSNSSQINVIHEYIVCFCNDKKFAPRLFINRLNNPSEANDLNNIIKTIKKEFNVNGIDCAKNLLKDLIKQYCDNHNVSWIKNYNNIDDNGRIFFAKDLSTPNKPRVVDIPSIDLHLNPLPTRGWSSDAKFIKLYNDKRLSFKGGRPYEIEYLDEAVDNITSILDFYSRFGSNDLKKLGLYGLFDTPKPVEMIKFLIRATLHQDSLILDFYAGSGTTAQAVYEVNLEDNRKHKYILIQQKELLNKNTEVYKNAVKYGFNNPTVSDLMIVRINKYLELSKQKIDYILKYINE